MGCGLVLRKPFGIELTEFEDPVQLAGIFDERYVVPSGENLILKVGDMVTTADDHFTDILNLRTQQIVFTKSGKDDLMLDADKQPLWIEKALEGQPRVVKVYTATKPAPLSSTPRASISRSSTTSTNSRPSSGRKKLICSVGRDGSKGLKNGQGEVIILSYRGHGNRGALFYVLEDGTRTLLCRNYMKNEWHKQLKATGNWNSELAVASNDGVQFLEMPPGVNVALITLVVLAARQCFMSTPSDGMTLNGYIERCK